MRNQNEVVEEVVDEVDLQEVWNVLQQLRNHLHKTREDLKEFLINRTGHEIDENQIRGQALQCQLTMAWIDNKLGKTFPEFQGENDETNGISGSN